MKDENEDRPLPAPSGYCRLKGDFINVEELGVRDEEDIDERVVEKEIVQNIKNFILKFLRKT